MRSLLGHARIALLSQIKCSLFPCMSKSSDEKVIYLKNSGKEIYIESYLPQRQMSLSHMVYSIAAQMVEHKGDPGAWKSTQRKVLDREQFKRLRITSQSTQPQGVTQVQERLQLSSCSLAGRACKELTQAFLSVE